MFIRKLSNATLLIFTLFSINFSLIGALSEKRVLKEHQIVNAYIKGSDKHRYHIELKKDQFAEIRLVQKGEDLMVSTFDTQGEKIQVFDLTSNYGEELATITSDIAGNYILEIQPFADIKVATNYSLEVRDISAKALTPSAKVDQYLARWDSASSPGLAIAVVKDGEIIHSNGFGLANLEYSIPISPSTVFDVASISKQFAAFSILLLAHEGQLSIDDTVREYLPELSDFGHEITIKHLLHHTSGLREQGVLRAMAGWRHDDITTQAQAFTLLTMQNDLNFAPGETFEYSNSGYFLLAQVVTKVSGQSFSAFTKSRIFEPLGMLSSAFPTDYQTVILNKAYSYRVSKDGFVKSILHSTMVGSTGLTTTVEDLAKWATNFEQPKVGSYNIIQQMKTPGVFNNGETTNYAFGQVLDNFRGAEAFGHGGTMAGFKTFLLRMPSQKLSVIVLANLPYLNPLNTAYEIAEFYLSALPQTTPKTKGISKKTLESYSGDYEILGGLSYTITQDNQQLYLQIMGAKKQLLTHLTDNEFSFGNEGRKLRFGSKNHTKVNKITLVEGIYGGQLIDGQRVVLPSFNSNMLELSEFTGRFYSQELDTTYEFIIENNQLKAQNLRSEVYLTPYDTDRFSGNTGFFLRANFIRNKDSEISGIEVSGTLINKLKFVKVSEVWGGGVRRLHAQ